MNPIKLLRKIKYLNNKYLSVKPDMEYIISKIFHGSIGVQPLTFLDIGANEGQTIDSFLKATHNKVEIFSFEPTPELVEKLRSKYAQLDNVKIISTALSNSSGETSFTVSDFSATNSLLDPNTELYAQLEQPLYETLKKSEKIVVQKITLDEWYKSQMESRDIDLLKSDTQGYEYEVLSGGINTIREHVKVLVTEIQFLNFYKNSTPFYTTFELLYKNGFYLLDFIENNKLNNIQVVECNAVFLNQKFFPLGNQSQSK